MSTQTISDAELEELVHADIPCIGIRNRNCARECGRAAVLRKVGHGHPETLYDFKCIACWQVWYTRVARTLADHGHIRCIDCGHRFYSVESFADYRPF